MRRHFVPDPVLRYSTDFPAVRRTPSFFHTLYDFFRELFGRDSLDGRGLPLRSTVHYGSRFNNALWNGEQMVFGDGDGMVFRRFTAARDVVAHELAHGVVGLTAGFAYEGESGALHEHFADVFGILVHQWRSGQPVERADWRIGEEILVPAATRRALRDMAAPGQAFRNDPILGDDPQPAHVRDLYRGTEDYGGVHINSGIPNHAFYTAAVEIGGNAWEKAGRIWYEALLRLHGRCGFADCAQTTFEVAGQVFGQGSLEHQAVRVGWAKVGVSIAEGVPLPDAVRRAEVPAASPAPPAGAAARAWRALARLFGGK